MQLKQIIGCSIVLLAALTGAEVWAAQPVNWGLGFQPAATPVMEQTKDFHFLLLWIISGICLVVLGLLLYVMVRFNAKANPEPRKFSHNTTVEVIWTIVPMMILVVIAIPSFRLLYTQDEIPEADMTIKVTGNQWNWGYEYPDHGGFEFVAKMLTDEEADERTLPRKLATDENVVVPAGATVRLHVTASDVLHSWTIPAFGVKMDAVTGRLNETWFRVDKPGVYYGQCSEICGVQHAYMPIAVEVVSEEEFQAWVDQKRGVAGLEPMFEDAIQVADAQ